MPFREKVAWIAVVSTTLVWGTFFGLFLWRLGQPGGHGRADYQGFIGAVVVQLVLTIGASIITAIAAPADAGAAHDERDRAIMRRSTAIAYPVLICAVVAVAASMHLGNGKIGMAYGIMAAIVIAELVHYGAQIVGYRSGWHD